MKTIKVSEATNIQLDWLVAKCEGRSLPVRQIAGTPIRVDVSPAESTVFAPSTDWSQAGPILEREGMGVWMYQWNEQGEPERGWYAEDKDGDHVRKGPTSLVATMRCFVSSKLGETVEVPDELN